MADRTDLYSMQSRLELYEEDLERAIDDGDESEIKRLTRIIEALKNEIDGILLELESEK